MSNDKITPTTHIYKYSLHVDNFQELMLPKDAKILSVQVQDGNPMIWALIKQSNPLECRKFIIVGTGHFFADELLEKLVYISTFQLYGGSFVGHLFEKIKE